MSVSKTMIGKFLAWVQEHVDPATGTVEVSVGRLREAGLPERFVRRLASRLVEVTSKPHPRLEIVRRRRVGRQTEYTVRLLPGAGKPERRRGRTGPTGTIHPTTGGMVSLRLRLVYDGGALRLDLLEVEVHGLADVRRHTPPAPPPPATSYEKQAAQIVENLSRVQSRLDEVDALRSSLAGLEEKVAGLELRLGAVASNLDAVILQQRRRPGSRTADVAKITRRLFGDNGGGEEARP